MARKPVVSPESLAALGAEKLARLVLGEAERSAPFRKLVNAALAAAKGPEAVAAQVDRRLAALEKARGFVDWEKVRAFAADLDATLRVISDELAPASPSLALGCLLRFLATAEGVFDRVDDEGGRVSILYDNAAASVGELAAKLAEPERRLLPTRLAPMLDGDGYALGRTAAIAAIPHLPPDALAAWDADLAATLARLQAAPEKKARGRRVSSWSADTGDLEARMAVHSLLVVRQAIAEAGGNLDGLVKLEAAKPEQFQDTLGMAGRLLEAGRPAEALEWVKKRGRRGIAYLDAAGFADRSEIVEWGASGRMLLEARILDALGRKAEAQALRWGEFETTLDVEALRAYVAHLGDFEEFDVLDRAFAHAKASKQLYRALAFFLRWPRLDLAAEQVLAHAGSWDGRHYELLGVAAETLEEKHPLAATVLIRALLADILKRAKSQAYGHGVRYLAALDRFGGKLPEADFTRAGIAPPATFRAELEKAHGRKAAFWSQVKAGRR